MSQRALSEDQFEGHLFHATHPRNVESILKTGIEARAASEGQRPGVYGWHNIGYAAGYGGHKMAVIEYKPTTIHRTSGGAYSVSDAIPPENIVKVHGPW